MNTYLHSLDQTANNTEIVKAKSMNEACAKIMGMTEAKFDELLYSKESPFHALNIGRWVILTYYKDGKQTKSYVTKA